MSGEAGSFQVELVQRPRYIDESKCIACGECAEKCPKKVVDPYNAGLVKRKAAYVEYAQAVPLKYAIDHDNCIYFKNGKCGACKKFCPTEAVDFEQKETVETLDVGSIILAPGFKPFDPSRFDNYRYSDFPNVITSIEFERILAATGPTEGHLVKMSNQEEEPKKIAWFQCVGSRDLNKCDNAYCSSVCCMYALKEAMIAKEHAGDELDCAIFNMDIRSFGKDFEKYYNTAKDKYGVRFLKSRVHTVSQIQGTDDLEVSYVTDEGEMVTETFNQIVLSVGMEIAPEVVDLAQRLGIELTDGRFCKTTSSAPVTSSVDGIFVCGSFQGPKDIPESIMEASSAANCAAMQLAEARGTLTQEKSFPGEIDIEGQEARVGVFVCNCGVNIGGIADVPAIAEYAKGLPNVVYVQENLFTCSQDTQDQMAEVIKEKNLNRVVVAACTPRTHEPLFQETLRNSGLNPYLFEMANIRNQCTWVHSTEKDKATEKSKDLVRMAAARASLLDSISDIAVDVNKAALVIGGGVAGMSAAISLAEQGFPATIVEKNENLGGVAKNVSTTWKGQDVQELLTEVIQKVEQNPDIHVLTNAEVTDASGFVGNFETTVSVEGKATAIQHGATIIATGGQASEPDEYLYGRHPGVTKWHELDQNSQKLQDAESVVFIQCVGSRDDQRPYCSRICCTGSIMQAIGIKEKSPGTHVFILYRDIRTYGEREALYKKARQLGVIFIRYSLENKPVVTEAGDALEVTVFDPILQRKVMIRADLVNLASAIVPNENSQLAEMYKLPVNAENFFMEAHAKLRPVDFASDGIFMCGLAHYPKSTEESIAQAMAAASRAATVLSRDSIKVSPLVSQVDQEKCIGCGLCTEVCAFSAIVLEEEDGKRKAKNIPASCKGCGLCASSCPQHAIDMLHFRRQQILAAVCAAA